MVTIRPIIDSDVSLLAEIKLAPSQIEFAATPEAFLQQQGCDNDQRFVIESEGRLVGFFKVVPDFYQQHDFCPDGAIGLRSFVIDNRWQGRGLGSASVAKIVAQLGQSYPQAKQIYLTVNCRNPAARTCYLKGGFIDTEQLYFGGPVGPQHIMCADIRV